MRNQVHEELVLLVSPDEALFLRWLADDYCFRYPTFDDAKWLRIVTAWLPIHDSTGVADIPAVIERWKQYGARMVVLGG
jgi:hypothetical protein